MRQKRNKYGVSEKSRRTVDGITFASKAESFRYSELKLLTLSGHVSELELQPRFDCFVEEVFVCTYIADFRYRNEHGDVVVEDVKGMRTPVYKLKKKLVEALFGIRIVEI